MSRLQSTFGAPHGTDDGLALWLGPLDRRSIDPKSLTTGLVTVDAVASRPSFVTLVIHFADPAYAPLSAPLERVGRQRYRTTVQLIAPATEAWLEVRSGQAGTRIDATLTRPSVLRLARLGLGALHRHAAAPVTFLRKLVQITRGGASLVLSERATDPPDAAERYASWRSAFEGDGLRRRLADAWRRENGGRPVRLLASAPSWPGTALELEQVLSSLRDADGTQLVSVSATRAQLARAIERERPDVVICLDRPGRFHALAPLAFTLALARTPLAVAVTADHDELDANGDRGSPRFNPAWSPRYQLSANYVRGAAAFRPSWLSAGLTGAPDGSAPTTREVFAELIDQRQLATHVPLVLFHGTDRDTATETPSATSRKRPHNSAPPAVSVIIPTKENPAMLAAAIASVRAAVGVDAEVIVVDNGAESTAQKAVLQDVAARTSGHGRGKVLAAHEPFNFSALINRGRTAASGDVLVLLNDDVEALEPDWLRALADEALEADTGAVGALLIYPDGRVQHAGVVLGINGGAGHAWRFADPNDPSASDHVRVKREVSAVTGACLAVRAEVFDRAGGFSEELPVTLNDVDFCLKLRALGLANLYLPDARLIHRESTSRGLDATPDKLRRLARETAVFVEKWGQAALSDPYLSPHIDPAREDFRPRSL